MAARRLAPALLLAFATATGCSDHEDRSKSGTLTGRVTLLETNAPIEGVRVYLLDPTTDEPVAGVATTNQDGIFRVEEIPPGYYHPLIAGSSRILYAPMKAAVRITAGDPIQLDFRLADYPGLGGSGLPIRGTVRDASTGEPIAGAWVSIGRTDPAFLFSGALPPWEDRSDAKGEFLLENVPIIERPGDNFLYPIVATAVGYRPGATGSLARMELLPLTAPNGDTLVVELLLEPGEGGRRLSGVVLHGGDPVAGVPVALSYSDPDTQGAHAGTDRSRLDPRSLVPGAVTVTGPSGEWSFDRLWPGRYRIHAAYLADDGWVTAGIGEPLPPAIILRDQDRVGITLQVLPAIELLDPVSLAVVSTNRPRLSWRRLAGVGQYSVRFSRANSFLLTEVMMTTDTTATIPPGYFRTGDSCRWAVQVYSSDRLVASSESVGTFRVETPGP